MKIFLKIFILVLIIAGVVFIVRSVQKAPGEITDLPEPDYEVVSLPDQPGLPAAVAAKRQAIAAATSYEELAALASQNFSYSFGGPHPEGFLGYLRQYSDGSESDTLNKIYTLLSLPYVKQGDIYTWPAVFAKEAKDWTEEDMEMMRAVSTDEEIEAYRLYGAYTGHRIGIRENGEWIYYIAGD